MSTSLLMRVVGPWFLGGRLRHQRELVVDVRIEAIFILVDEYRSGTALDRVFSAVSDATRRAILARLAESDARVTDVASAFPISLNSTSKHIRVLEGAGLVRRRVRGREHFLSLDAAPLAEAASWCEHYRSFWSDQLAALDALVAGRAHAGRSS